MYFNNPLVQPTIAQIDQSFGATHPGGEDISISSIYLPLEVISFTYFWFSGLLNCNLETVSLYINQ